MPRMVDGFELLGDPGFERGGGVVDDEYHNHLQGDRRFAIYREMGDEPTLAAFLFFFETWLSRVRWRVKRAEVDAELRDLAEEAAVFLEECQDDLDHTWTDLISDGLSMLQYGFAPMEVVYKLRNGKTNDKRTRSKYSDGLIGWRKFVLLKQSTISRWKFDDDEERPEGEVVGLYQNLYNTDGGKLGEIFVPREKLINFTTKRAGGNPEGRSMLRSAYTAFYFAKKLRMFEAISVEKDVVGIPHLRAPAEYLSGNAPAHIKSMIASMKLQLAQLRRGERAYIVTPATVDRKGAPTGWDFELLHTGGARLVNTDPVIRRHQRDMAITTMSEIISMGTEAVGARSLGETKRSLVGLAMMAIAERMVSVANKEAVEPLFALNEARFPREVWPRFEVDEIDTPNLKDIAEFLKMAFGFGAIQPDEEIESWLRNLVKAPEKTDDFDAVEEDPNLDRLAVAFPGLPGQADQDEES